MNETDNQEILLRFMVTSDTHGKFGTWNYAADCEERSGSMTQICTAVRQYRTDCSVMIDAGDLFQGNMAELFVGDEEIHPMIQALNEIGCDIWVTGNHDYDYGIPRLKKMISQISAKTLTGNVCDQQGNVLADGYTVIERNGIRIAVIGMTTPGISSWNPGILKGCRVTAPIDETRKILDELNGNYDMLVGVYHMGPDDQYGFPHSGVTEICEAFPGFDFVIAAHTHKLLITELNGVPVVENEKTGKTMIVADFTFGISKEGWKIKSHDIRSIDISEFEPDPELAEKLTGFDLRAKENARRKIGRLEGGPLLPDNEISEIPAVLLEDTALMSLIGKVFMHYAGTDTAAVPVFSNTAIINTGDFRYCDAARAYRHENLIYKFRMNGRQLKTYMDWAVSYYNTFHPGDLTVSFREDLKLNFFAVFKGVEYDVDISREPGHRIENLRWPDGTAVKEDDEFTIAVIDFAANTFLLTPGVIFGEDNIPELIERDVRDDIGTVREMIADYIENVMNGSIQSSTDGNWHLKGCRWDPGLHAEAVRILEKRSAEEKKKLYFCSFTAADLQ